MSKLIQQITALRESMRNADVGVDGSFSRVFDEFHDISEGTELIEASKPFKDKVIRGLLEVTARRHLGDPQLVVTHLMILRHGPTGLFHGGFHAGDTTGNFFFFLEDKQGIVAFIRGTTLDFYRLSAVGLPEGTVIGKKRFSLN